MLHIATATEIRLGARLSMGIITDEAMSITPPQQLQVTRIIIPYHQLSSDQRLSTVLVERNCDNVSAGQFDISHSYNISAANLSDHNLTPAQYECNLGKAASALMGSTRTFERHLIGNFTHLVGELNHCDTVAQGNLWNEELGTHIRHMIRDLRDDTPAALAPHRVRRQSSYMRQLIRSLGSDVAYAPPHHSMRSVVSERENARRTTIPPSCNSSHLRVAPLESIAAIRSLPIDRSFGKRIKRQGGFVRAAAHFVGLSTTEDNRILQERQRAEELMLASIAGRVNSQGHQAQQIVLALDRKADAIRAEFESALNLTALNQSLHFADQENRWALALAISDMKSLVRDHQLHFAEQLHKLGQLTLQIHTGQTPTMLAAFIPNNARLSNLKQAVATMICDEKSLVIELIAPKPSEVDRIRVFKLTALPVRFGANTGSYLQVSLHEPYIAQIQGNLTVAISQATLDKCRSDFRVCFDGWILSPETVTCSQALFVKNLALVETLCPVRHMYFGPSAFVKILPKGRLVVSNVDSYSLECHTNSSHTLIEQPIKHDQVMNIPCDCKIRIANKIFTPRSQCLMDMWIQPIGAMISHLNLLDLSHGFEAIDKEFQREAVASREPRPALELNQAALREVGTAEIQIRELSRLLIMNPKWKERFQLNPIKFLEGNAPTIFGSASVITLIISAISLMCSCYLYRRVNAIGVFMTPTLLGKVTALSIWKDSVDVPLGVQSVLQAINVNTHLLIGVLTLGVFAAFAVIVILRCRRPGSATKYTLWAVVTNRVQQVKLPLESLTFTGAIDYTMAMRQLLEFQTLKCDIIPVKNGLKHWAKLIYTEGFLSKKLSLNLTNDIYLQIPDKIRISRAVYGRLSTLLYSTAIVRSVEVKYLLSGSNVEYIPILVRDDNADIVKNLSTNKKNPNSTAPRSKKNEITTIDSVHSPGKWPL